MRVRGLPILLLLLAAAHGARAEDAPAIEIEAPARVDAVRIEDVTGDGVADLLILEGRTLRVHPGRKGAPPPRAPRWQVEVPADASFVDVLTRRTGTASFALLGERGLSALALDGGGESAIERVAARLPWADWSRVTFADLVRADGSLLLPTSDGWRLDPPPGVSRPSAEVAAPPLREVRPPGAFVEDVGVATRGRAPVWIGPAPRGTGPDSPPVLWALGPARLRAAFRDQVLEFDVSFLPPSGELRLEDLDGDGAPEVIHTETTSLDATIRVFRTPPLARQGAALEMTGDSLRPAAATLRLPGYLIERTFTDLNGDGRLDLAATTVPVDARNTLRALGGAVTAYTSAFLNRGSESGRPYPPKPDARVASDVGVQIRFTAGGTLDIRRSFTIVPGGDFDGDGRRDLAIRTRDDALKIRRGTAAGVWAREGRRVAIPAIGQSPDADAWAGDLDGDGRDEVVFVYRRPHGGRDRIWIVRP